MEKKTRKTAPPKETPTVIWQRQRIAELEEYREVDLQRISEFKHCIKIQKDLLEYHERDNERLQNEVRKLRNPKNFCLN